jgi:hypothetical protein
MKWHHRCCKRRLPIVRITGAGHIPHMTTKLVASLVTTLGLLSFGSLNLRANAVETHVEVLQTPLTLVPGQPVNLFFPNEFDLIHQKVFHFTASARIEVGANPIPGLLGVQFDWLIPGEDDPGLSPLFQVPLTPNELNSIDLTWTIPFCPPEVSLHLVNLGTPIITLVDSVFTHECQTPETLPSIFGGMVLLGLVTTHWALRHKTT